MLTSEGAIERVLEFDLDTNQANRIVHHLTGQKLEYEAFVQRSENGDGEAIEALQEAKVHYDVIEFSRSSNRVNRKLDHLRSSVKDTAAVHRQSEPKATGDSGKSSTSTSGRVGSGDDKSLPKHPGWDQRSIVETDEWVEASPVDDVPFMTSEYDKIRSIDYPDQPESDRGEDEDPYVF